MNNWLFTIGRTLDAQLFVIGETQVRVSTLVTVVVMLAITVEGCPVVSVVNRPCTDPA